jgi:acyl-CoA thioesterase FadM
LSKIIASDAATACVEVNVRFFQPLLLDDKIDVKLFVDHVGTSSFILRSSMDKSAVEKCAEVRAIYVWTELSDVGPTGAKPLPIWLRKMLEF